MNFTLISGSRRAYSDFVLDVGRRRIRGSSLAGERGAQQRRVRHQPVRAGAGGEAFPDPGASNQSRRSRETTTRSCCRSLFRPESHGAFPKSLRELTIRCRMARLSTAERNSNGSNGARDALSETPIGNTKWPCVTYRSRHSALGNEQAPTEVGGGPAASVPQQAPAPRRCAQRAEGERSSMRPTPPPTFDLAVGPPPTSTPTSVAARRAPARRRRPPARRAPPAPERPGRSA